MRKIMTVWWRWRNRTQFEQEVSRVAKHAKDSAAGFVIGVTPPKGYTFNEVMQAVMRRAG